MEIVVTELMGEEGLSLLRATGPTRYDPNLYRRPDDLRACLADAAALVVRNQTRVTAGLLEIAPALRVVGRLGAGLDNIDLAAAGRRGVRVVYAPADNAVSVAEMTLGLILALAKKIPGANYHTHRGGWDRETWSGIELADKTLGILGLGRIGRLVAERARALGMDLLACHPRLATADSQVRELGIRLTDLAGLLRQSDVLSLHLPLRAETAGLIGPAELALMKPTALLVNTGRGGVVDQQALADVLAAGRLAGAALDVRDREPAGPEDPLAGRPDVLLTPHVAGLTAEAQARTCRTVARDVIRVLHGEAPSFPAPAPPEKPPL